VIAAQTGISGSCLIESHAVIGGQVGLGDHVTIKSGAVLASKCGVTSHKIVRGGQTYWGVPARPLKEYLAQLAAVSRLAKKK
jgi:UDP-3-O-[3-hydroxymyristoyl] glucosamine N-acyltransferase